MINNFLRLELDVHSTRARNSNRVHLLFAMCEE